MASDGVDGWEDREVRFDVPSRELAWRVGEKEIDSINAVEDTKGNNGIRGSLSVSNLRLVWVSHKDGRINLSIGLWCVTALKIKTAESKLRGKTQSLFVMASNAATKFEFIFTSLVKASPRLFTTAQAVYRAYDTSRLYRELKLRGAVIADGALRTLPDEEIYDTISGVWNLSSDQGNLGTFIVTNVRLVWFATLANNFNVSVPYSQIAELRTKNSKFGEALVVRTSSREGGYLLGFRVDPKERLDRTFEMVRSLHQLFSRNPNFGVRFSYDQVPKPLDEVREQRVEEDARIVEDYEGEMPGAMLHGGAGGRAYMTDAAANVGDAEEAPPHYCPELGLAVQALPKGQTVASLWSLLAS